MSTEGHGYPQTPGIYTQEQIDVSGPARHAGTSEPAAAHAHYPSLLLLIMREACWCSSCTSGKSDIPRFVAKVISTPDKEGCRSHCSAAVGNRHGGKSWMRCMRLGATSTYSCGTAAAPRTQITSLEGKCPLVHVAEHCLAACVMLT